MGYETTIYLAEQFSDRWVTKSKFYDQDHPQLGDLPRGAIICTDFISIAKLDLSKCGGGPVGALFSAGRTKQVKLKRYASVDYEGFTYVEGAHKGEQDQYSVLVDCYDSPLGLHDPEEVRDAIREEMRQDAEKGQRPYRRYVIAEALLTSCIEGGLTPLEQLAAQAKKKKKVKKGCAVRKDKWLFNNLVVLSYGH